VSSRKAALCGGVLRSAHLLGICCLVDINPLVREDPLLIMWPLIQSLSELPAPELLVLREYRPSLIHNSFRERFLHLLIGRLSSVIQLVKLLELRTDQGAEDGRWIVLYLKGVSSKHVERHVVSRR